MSPRLVRTADRIRKPEYTGSNRCMPCTIVNVVLAAVFGLGLAVVSAPLGLVVFAAGLSFIYLRGYLVPGTPTLTKRYLPDRLLALFDKDPHPRSSPVGPSTSDPTSTSPSDPELGEDGTSIGDPERLLRSLDAVEPCENVDDLCLTDAFESAWYARMSPEDGPDEKAVARLLDASEEAVTIHREGDGEAEDGNGAGTGRVSVSLSPDPDSNPKTHSGSTSTGGPRGEGWREWPSIGALAADVAAAEELESRSSEWRTLSVDHRLGILSALRMFLERCPRCDAPIVPGSETVESCCRSWEVLAVTCDECGERYLELDPGRLGVD